MKGARKEIDHFLKRFLLDICELAASNKNEGIFCCKLVLAWESLLKIKFMVDGVA